MRHFSFRTGRARHRRALHIESLEDRNLLSGLAVPQGSGLADDTALVGIAAVAGTPQVMGVSPFNGAFNVGTDTVVRATFDTPLDPSTVTANTVRLFDPVGTPVSATVAYESATNSATLMPLAPLTLSPDYYSVRISGGTGGVTSTGGVPLADDFLWGFSTETPVFSDSVVLSNLVQPTAVSFASDGRIFVAEKSGLIKVFDDFSDTTPTIFADLRTNVYNFWDRGLLGMALDPDFPNTPYVYVLYTYDAAIGGTAPLWGTPGATSDGCPNPPGATGDGCVVSGRLSRLEAAGNVMTGPEQVLIEDWAQQYPSHSIGSLAFGPDGALYASGGDGASFNFVDYGQDGDPLNPLGDPPVPIGEAQTPPTAEGGALRSLDLLTPGDPVTLDGSIIRIDPHTGLALPDNPRYGDSDPNAQRIVSFGLRNPFRFTVRPGTSELWVGDVGWNEWEEINVVRNPTDALVENFGWPAYEGSGRQPGYDAANLNLIENLYNDPTGHTEPFFAYRHSEPVVPGSGGATGSSSISGIAFATQGAYPNVLDGALFFADYSRKGIWVMFRGVDGDPDPASRMTVLPSAANPVELVAGTDGSLYYVDLLGGTIRRIEFHGENLAPSAVIQAAPTAGSPPLTVQFDASASTDPNGSAMLNFAWDLDGDGQFDDSDQAQTSFTYATAGDYAVQLRVTDGAGLSDVATTVIQVNASAPVAVIDTPLAGLTWKVGDTISFSGHATDLEDGTLPASSLSWLLVLHHCPSNCHEHPIATFTGAAGSFIAPDHEYPSYLELRLTATDSDGLKDTESVALFPQTVALSFQSNPSGLVLALGGSARTTPLSSTVIVGSTNSISAPSPQTLAGTTYAFSSWSDGGPQSHNIIAGATPQTWTADFAAVPPSPAITHVPALLRSDMWFYDLNGAGGIAEKSLNFGLAGDKPVFGDWNSDGLDEPATFRKGLWFFDLAGDGGPADKSFAFGLPGDLPFAGDYNGDGVTDIGVFRNGVWFFDFGADGGIADKAFAFGIPGDLPVTGDFNGDGRTDVGVFRKGMWFFDFGGDGGVADKFFAFGLPGDVPVAGDFNLDGKADAAVFRNGSWFFNFDGLGGVAQQTMVFGIPGDIPLAARQPLAITPPTMSGTTASVSATNVVITSASSPLGFASLSSTPSTTDGDTQPAVQSAALDGPVAAMQSAPTDPFNAGDDATLAVLAAQTTTNDDDLRADLLIEVLDTALPST